ncbi:MAG: hypothetical protein WBM40_19505, partial [Thiohalocapsa sp.]
LRGYFNYHAVPGNLKRLDGFRAEVTRAWRQSLMRRSQTHRMPSKKGPGSIKPANKRIHPNTFTSICPITAESLSSPALGSPLDRAFARIEGLTARGTSMTLRNTATSIP